MEHKRNPGINKKFQEWIISWSVNLGGCRQKQRYYKQGGVQLESSGCFKKINKLDVDRRKKSRIITLGYMQIPGVDYT